MSYNNEGGKKHRSTSKNIKDSEKGDRLAGAGSSGGLEEILVR